MKEFIGSPGTVSGLVLRIGQCAFAAASIGIMASASGFSSYTAFCYLIASMGLQGLWSFGLACLDVYALRRKRDLQNPVLVSLFVVGDWYGIGAHTRRGVQVREKISHLLESFVIEHKSDKLQGINNRSWTLNGATRNHVATS
ncbi:CASP-like protein 5B2 isoform X3 [Manihot esculenta]|uniref:CASP-like protein 5B2 isoform X3 n=1 Tax=Manihot esculenta TaxID=3983 RepID=UPI001CC5ECCA|nr:CASP-like protein 5B2 isoform X3 [Manihot esculenta]